MTNDTQSAPLKTVKRRFLKDVIAFFVFTHKSPKQNVNRSGLLKRDRKRRTINWVAG